MLLIAKESSDQLRQRDPILWLSLHQFDRATYDDRCYAGTILIDDREVCQLVQCVHCNSQFPNLKIPGKERGWCMNCNGPVCPNRQCDECVPFEAWLDAVEKNLPPSQRPVRAAVSAAFPRG